MAAERLCVVAMPVSVSQFVLRARQLELEALQQLAVRIDLVDLVGQLIHALQHERGATSIYLASSGERFVPERQAAMSASQQIEQALHAGLSAQLLPEQGASAKMLSLMAWVALDLDALTDLRSRVAQRSCSAHDAVAAFSGVIAGLLELIVLVADAASNPAISRLLVAFVHLVQGKEAAGQERAVGAQLFASGQCDEAEQQRVVQLIEAQERGLSVFEEFADTALKERWQRYQLVPNMAQLERLRRTLCVTRDGAALDPSMSENWFAAATARITEMWQIQSELVACLSGACATQIEQAKQSLQDSESLVTQLKANPPQHALAVARFFQTKSGQQGVPALPLKLDSEAKPAPSAATDPSMHVLLDVLKTQSARLASMEVELESARRALHERKLIERAKGVLMARLGLTEDAAFRALQKASMDHNRKLLDVAQATLSLPDVVFGERAGDATKR